MVDRIYKVDSPTNRVQETRDERGRRGGQGKDEEEERKDKDKFDKGRPFWKRLVPDSGGGPVQAVRTRLAGERPSIPLGVQDESLRASETSDTGSTGSLEESEEEVSLTMSQRLLVLWGILDISGRPRPRVITVYSMIAVVIILSTVLILGMLWR